MELAAAGRGQRLKAGRCEQRHEEAVVAAYPIDVHTWTHNTQTYPTSTFGTFEEAMETFLESNELKGIRPQVGGCPHSLDCVL